MPPTKILAPMDGSPFSKRVLTYICRLFEPQHSHITLLRVAPQPAGFTWPPPPLFVDNGWTWLLPDYQSERDMELARHPIFASQVWESFKAELLDSMTEDLQCLHDSGFQVSLAVRLGDPVSEMSDFVQRERIDLVVMATHGRSGLWQVVMGSVAEGVLNRVAIPVLMLRPRMVVKPGLQEQTTSRQDRFPKTQERPL